MRILTTALLLTAICLPANSQTSADKRKSYCEANNGHVEYLMTTAIISSEVIIRELRSDSEVANINRLISIVNKKYKSYTKRCQSNSATLGSVKVRQREFIRAAQALNNKVGNIK